MQKPAPVVLDTNVFIAAQFSSRSSSARIIERVRAGQLRMVWNEQTRRETRYILKKIPPLSWYRVEPLFVVENLCSVSVHPEKYGVIPDPEDRKFAALASVSGAVLVSNDEDLLSVRSRLDVTVLTPAEFARELGI